ncbi:MAG: mechanosensitive ion channel family protein, partial [Verrucomicrobia subdivision 3 bacterium]|nr:mechanosensitive ion channel family protein [Limisphaerales bacterium]
RTGPTNSAITVTIGVIPGGTAAPGEFTLPSGPVQIPPGKSTQTVPISITDDLEEDGDKTAILALTELSGGAVVGNISTAQLLITDNESGQAAWLTFGLDRIPLLRRTVLHIPLWQYIASLIYIFLAFYLSKLIDYWMRGRVKRWAGRTRTSFDDILLELMGRPVRIIVFVVLLHVGLRIFSWPQWFADFLSKALKIIVAVSLTYAALRFVDVLSGYWKRRASAEEDRSFAEQLLPIIRKSLKAFAVVVAVLLTLQNLGLNITSLITSLGIGGLALALAAQDTLANFFGAIVILVDKPFRIGDIVRLEPIEGTVESIGFRSTRVRTADGHLVAIPNKTVGNSIVTNKTR